MDFHSLSRRELQALCKRNKIPANMTNVAMADALKSLETVEGFEEIMNHFLSNPAPTPVSTARTVTRTARRKTIEEETQISQTASRACHIVRKSLDQEMDQENENISVGEAKSDAKLLTNDPKTPAAQSTRRRGPTTSTKNIASGIHGSVQQVYSTRRSVRLLEKTMADLTLTGKKPVEPVNIDESLTEAKEDVEDPTGAVEESELIPGRNLSSTLEKEWDMRDKHPKDDKSKTVTFSSEKSVILEDISLVDVKTETEEEKMNKFGTCLPEDLEDASDGKGSDDIHVPENSYESAKEETIEPVESPKKMSIMFKEETDDKFGNTATELNTKEDDIHVPENSSESAKKETLKPAESPQKMSIMFEEESHDKLDNTATELYRKDESESQSESETESEPESEQSGVYSDQEVESGENATIESDQSDIDTDSGMDSDETNKENFNNGGIGIKTEPAAKNDELKKKNNAMEEEDLKGFSLRQLTKMVKELQIKNRPALQKLPGDQIVEEN